MTTTPTDYLIGDADRMLLGLAVGLDTRAQRLRKPRYATEYTEAEAREWVEAGMDAAAAVPLEDVPKDIRIIVSASPETLNRLRAMVEDLKEPLDDEGEDGEANDTEPDEGESEERAP